MFETIESLEESHLGETAWMFGKGPGLDLFEFEKAGPLRICINESLIRVPQPTYWFAHDQQPIANIAPIHSSSARAVLQPDRAQYACSLGVSPQHIYTYRKRQIQRPDRTPEAWEPAELLGLTGTVHSAMYSDNYFSRVTTIRIPG